MFSSNIDTDILAISSNCFKIWNNIEHLGIITIGVSMYNNLKLLVDLVRNFNRPKTSVKTFSSYFCDVGVKLTVD